MRTELVALFLLGWLDKQVPSLLRNPSVMLSSLNHGLYLATDSIKGEI